MKTLSELKQNLTDAVADFDLEKAKLLCPDTKPERLYHKKCGALVKRRWWWQKPSDPDMPICVLCDERVAESDLLTYEEWKGRDWD